MSAAPAASAGAAEDKDGSGAIRQKQRSAAIDIGFRDKDTAREGAIPILSDASSIYQSSARVLFKEPLSLRNGEIGIAFAHQGGVSSFIWLMCEEGEENPLQHIPAYAGRWRKVPTWRATP